MHQRRIQNRPIKLFTFLDPAFYNFILVKDGVFCIKILSEIVRKEILETLVAHAQHTDDVASVKFKEGLVKDQWIRLV